MELTLAYFDPSAGSLLLQALVGGFGGIVVLGRYLWMKFTHRNGSHSMPPMSTGSSHKITAYKP